jgi:hypothetical protein
MSNNVHLVSVGKDGFMYEPNNITAAVGDTVVFEFYPTNHSVVQGVYCGDIEGGCNPCVPIEVAEKGTKGFASQNYLTSDDPAPDNFAVCLDCKMNAGRRADALARLRHITLPSTIRSRYGQSSRDAAVTVTDSKTGSTVRH